jgi:hypothetical protein
MTELLQQAIAQVNVLPDSAQNAIATIMLQAIPQAVPEVSKAHSSIDRQARIQKMQDFRAMIVTHGPALSQTIIDSREGERY